jgi:hypothetical protein
MERIELIAPYTAKTKQQPQQPAQQPSVTLAKLSPLETDNKRHNLCGICRIAVRIFLHRRWG